MRLTPSQPSSTSPLAKPSLMLRRASASAALPTLPRAPESARPALRSRRTGRSSRRPARAARPPPVAPPRAPSPTARSSVAAFVHRRLHARQRRGDLRRVFADQVHRPAAPPRPARAAPRSPGPCPGRRGSGGSCRPRTRRARRACSRRSSPWSRSPSAHRRCSATSSRRCAHARERAQPRAHRVGLDPARQADGGRGHRVLHVVRARQAQLVDRQQRAAPPTTARPALSDSAAPGPSPKHTRRAQPAEVLDRLEPERRDRDVVVALAREDLELRRRGRPRTCRAGRGDRG